ncbi:MAG TPA: hypothetical protein VEY67_04220 [Candidatus Dormibacteraeota bacterium]|nr:hypothetical protein [Candidatus Dormibacteraeota bacterium]
MSDADFVALASSWHDFYLTAGASAATLIGLLFVGLSINLDEFTSDGGTGIRLLGEQAFSNFVLVLLIAFFVLIPGQQSGFLAVELALVGAIGTIRVAVRAVTVRRRPVGLFSGRGHLVRRFGLSAVASLGVLGVAAMMPASPTAAFYWLIGVVMIYLTSAAVSAWDLLIEVGRERRRVT